MANAPRKNPALTDDEKTSGIVLMNGEPFATQEIAELRRRSLALDPGAWHIEPHGNGYAIVRDDGESDSAKTAEEFAENDDPAEVIVADDYADDDPKPAQEATGSHQAEPYYWVRFHSKSNPFDPDDVILAVNGDVLQIRRNERIPIARRFLECADHARYRHFTQEPGKDRKVDREIHKYPYDMLGEASAQDFRTWKAKGTRINRDYAEAHGLAVEN